MEVGNKSVEKTERNNRSFGGFIKFVGKHGWDFAKRAWRLDAVQSAALTWAIRVSPIGGAIVVGIIDSYMGIS